MTKTFGSNEKPGLYVPQTPADTRVSPKWVFLCWGLLCMCVCDCEYSFFFCAHMQGTRVLLISVRAREQPIKVSAMWWMCSSRWASVFNRSHWRNGSTSASKNFLSCMVREPQMWTRSQTLVSLLHILLIACAFDVITMNGGPRPLN